MKKKSFKIMAPIVIVVLILIALVVFYNHGISAVSSQDKEVVVQIESGSGVNQIIDCLDEAGLIQNKLCAKIYMRINKHDNLKANTYIFSTNMSLSKIVSIMQDPEEKYLIHTKLTIKDGQTIPQVASEFAKILNITEDEVIQQLANPDYLNKLIDEYWFIDESILNKDLMYPLEGYLYPETYYVSEKNPTVESMAKLALDMMDKKLTPLQDRIKKSGWSVHEFLSFVSIVERESGSQPEDKNKIAGVFMNRLNIHMKLQSDITVNYALQRTGVNVSIKQTQTDSPYNTYAYEGLPVGPISTVLDDTMERCLDYAHHKYYYFFADENGKVIYSETHDQHKKVVEENKWY